MKLSFRFFCIAYIVVLLATGIGGSLMVSNINASLWDARVERVDAAVNYAADSFTAFADASYNNKLSEAQLADAVRQIKGTLDSTVSSVEILPVKSVDSQYAKLTENVCASTFTERDNSLLMEAVCKMNVGASEYCLFVYSDFTDIQKQCDLFWRRYGIVVICVSVVSGLLLFALTKKITGPLNKLADVADEIALGNYGKQAEIPGSEDEISALATSVNSMSAAIEQKIKEIRDELEKRNMFVADFTHEMKTPMTAIMGYAQMLRSYQLEETEKDQAAEAIYGEAKRLEKLSLQLLELYVYQNESVEMETISLTEIGEQLNTTIRFLSEKYNVSYTIDLGSENVSANRVLLLSLLYNLADNAFKASEPGTSVRIYSTVADNGTTATDTDTTEADSGAAETDTDAAAAATIRITVEDEGRGIAEENIKLLTEPFFREDKARSRKLGGAGLGLTLCREIARIHGTELAFESEKGKGTRVSFSLPKGGAAE
ncbi:MAG: HAMP domain-containing histidine kinase [Lachnospiraceae bacterium]|nr:HAMP domain-containing histidine kinase [Lachnospiraceae bacterium]